MVLEHPTWRKWGNLLRQLTKRMGAQYVTHNVPQAGQSASVEAQVKPKPAAQSDLKLEVRPNPKLVADIELVERFSFQWESNASSYSKTLERLRAAARRVLPVLSILDTSTDQGSTLPGGMAARLDNIADQVACLAHHPLYFPETFHGVQMLPDGSFTPLQWSERVHFWPKGLLGPEDLAAVAQIYERVSQSNSAPLRVVEIGSAVGRGSTRVAGEYIKRSGGSLYCIDVWNETDRYFAFIANMKIFDFDSIVIPIRSQSPEAAKLFDDKSLDAVFIDGSHFYRDVLADIDAYTPKVRKGGYLFGHDLLDLPSRFDRNKLLSVSNLNNTEMDYTNAQGEVVRGNVHPGVVLAIQDRYGDDVELIGGSVVWAKQV